MRMPEPEEDKVTATGGGLRASGLLKLGGIRRSLLKKGLFVLQCALTESMLLCVCAFFDRATRLSRLRLRLTHTFVLQSAWSTLHVSLREASLRMRMSSKVKITLFTR